MIKNIDIQSGQLQLKVEHSDLPLEELCGFACRQNPKRGFLFVSKVLGKHYPVKPSKMEQIYSLLQEKISSQIEQNDIPLFLGFAETATGLSSGVYHSWKNQNINKKSYFIHTTRYHLENQNVLFNFQEEHSHATGHIVYHPENTDFLLNTFNTLVLIDDEITTGKTMTNFIEGFLSVKDCNIKKIIIVSIKNWMIDSSVKEILAKFSNIDIKFVHILKGTYKFVKNEDFTCDPMPSLDGGNDYKNSLIKNNYGRLGLDKMPNYDFSQLVNGNNFIDLNKKTLVLGTGEFSFYPFLLAQYLEHNKVDVVYQSTTRSPILIGSDIGHKITFIDNYGDDISNFVYNVYPGQYEQVIICYETENKQRFNLDETLNAKNVFFDQLTLI